MKKLLILALPIVLSACSTVPEIPSGKSRPVNTVSEIERLYHDRSGLMVVGAARDDNEVKERLLIRPMDSEGLVTVPGGDLVERKVTATFGPGRWKLVLTPEQTFQMMQLSAAAERVEVCGYTDAIYNNAKNESVAMRRAESGINYLIDRGFPQDKISKCGMASGGHVADNTTKAGQAMNRRVEFEFSVDSWENEQ